MLRYTLNRVLLIEAGPSIVSAFPEPLRTAARRDLERLGVEVHTNTPVTRIGEHVVEAGGQTIEASSVLWAAGVAASPLGATLGAPLDRAGRVLVNPDLTIPGHANVFVIGDLASLNGPDGKPYPGGGLEVHFDKQRGNVLGSPFRFAKHGASGIELCELLPHTAGIVDDITMIRSMSTESVDHESALRLIHTGRFLAGMPVWGSWVVYALGTENANLPAYVVLTDPGGLPVDGERN